MTPRMPRPRIPIFITQSMLDKILTQIEDGLLEIVDLRIKNQLDADDRRILLRDILERSSRPSVIKHVDDTLSGMIMRLSGLESFQKQFEGSPTSKSSNLQDRISSLEKSLHDLYTSIETVEEHETRENGVDERLLALELIVEQLKTQFTFTKIPAKQAEVYEGEGIRTLLDAALKEGRRVRLEVMPEEEKTVVDLKSKRK